MSLDSDQKANGRTILSMPGKTFLVGEYLALEGGPSLILSTEPRFQLTLSEANERKQAPFSPHSPAGRFLTAHAAEFSQLSIRFDDPHLGRGGLGASSAQFALLYVYHCAHVNKKSFENITELDWRTLLEEYRRCAYDGKGTPPSGADVVAQLTGGVTHYDGRCFQARRLEWNFQNLAFTLVRTGFKLATHEHLRQAKDAPHESLRRAVSKATKAFETQTNDRESLLCEAVEETASALFESGLMAEGTRGLLREMADAQIGVRAAKGCGAMGADVILILHNTSAREPIASWVHKRGLEICGSDLVLSDGLRS